MRIRRTANAGVLIDLDQTTVLLDGVCKSCSPYYGTTEAEKEFLLACAPDITAFTHGHLDHFDREFACKLYNRTLRPILGPEGLLKQGCICEPVRVGAVTVTPIPSRHIGKAGREEAHVSYLVEGSVRILFAGDAAPTQLRGQTADILIAPYAWVLSPEAWRLASEIAPDFILVHMPQPEADTMGLWSVVDTLTAQPGAKIYIPRLGETIHI